MRLMLDTHAFIWLDEAPEKLSDKALAACRDATNTLHLSLASLWEMQIKIKTGKWLSRTLWKSCSDVIRAKTASLWKPSTCPTFCFSTRCRSIIAILSTG